MIGEPPISFHQEWQNKHRLIKEMSIQDICKDILRKGDRTLYQDVLDFLHEYIEDNIEKFL